MQDEVRQPLGHKRQPLTPRIWLVLTALCTLALLTTFPVSTRAQDTPPTASEPPVTVGTIAISATKTRRDPMQTPGEVNSIDREEIERTQAQSLDDVLRYQPGVDMSNGPRRISELPVIRGLSGPRVLTTIDGVRLNFISGHQGRLFLDVDALKLIEVVRGPNSALWGSGALGGVLALTTVDPSDFLEPQASIGARLKFGFQAVNDEFLGSPMVFGRLGSDVEYLALFTTRSAGDIRLGGDAGTLENSAEDLHSGLGKVIWHMTPHDELRFSIQGFLEDGEVPTNPAVIATDPASLVDRETTQLTYRLGYTHDNSTNPYLHLAGFVYYTSMDIRERRLSDNRPDAIDFDTVGLDLRNSTSLRASSQHHHRLTYGIEYVHDKQRAERAGAANTLFPQADSNTVSLYLQDEISLWNRLFLIPALRWDHFANDADGQPDVTESQVSPKIGGVLKVTDFLYLEANYAEGFRTPTFGELFIAGTHFPGAIFVPNPNLKPEKSKNIDVGVRIRRERLFAQHDAFMVRGTYFHNSLDDFIDFAVTFNPATFQLEFQPVNVQEAVIEGFEAELRWAFLPGFEFWANYTDITGDNETDDQPLANIPPRKGVIGLSYLYAPWGVTVGGRVQIADDQDRVPDGVQETSGYTVYDLFANWQPATGPLRGLRVDVGIDNVTDEEYRRHLSGIPEAGINPKMAISYTKNW